jgi:hypothetical protein
MRGVRRVPAHTRQAATAAVVACRYLVKTVIP